MDCFHKEKLRMKIHISMDSNATAIFSKKTIQTYPSYKMKWIYFKEDRIVILGDN